MSKKLISYSDTRFGGAYDMLVVFSNVFEIDKDFLYDVCEFLFLFVSVLDILSDSKRP